MTQSLGSQDEVTTFVQSLINDMIGSTIYAVGVYWHASRRCFIAHEKELSQPLRDQFVTAIMRSNSQEQNIATPTPLVAFGQRRGTIGFLAHENTSIKEGRTFQEQCQLLAVALAWGEQLATQKQHKLENINTLLAMLDLLDPITLKHSKNVANLALLLADEFKCTTQQTEALYYGAMFHSIGKLGLPSSLVSKKDNFSADELAILRSYPIRGVGLLQHFTNLQDIIAIVKYHHEHFDGSGYPLGLRGEQIPFGARLVAVADAFNHLLSTYDYKNTHAKQEALATIERETNIKFDPQIIAALKRVVAGL